MVQGFITSSICCKILVRVAGICIQLLGWHQMVGITDCIPWQDRFVALSQFTKYTAKSECVFTLTLFIPCSMWKRKQTSMLQKFRRWFFFFLLSYSVIWQKYVGHDDSRYLVYATTKRRSLKWLVSYVLKFSFHLVSAGSCII